MEPTIKDWEEIKTGAEISIKSSLVGIKVNKEILKLAEEELLKMQEDSNEDTTRPMAKRRFKNKRA